VRQKERGENARSLAVFNWPIGNGFYFLGRLRRKAKNEKPASRKISIMAAAGGTPQFGSKISGKGSK